MLVIPSDVMKDLGGFISWNISEWRVMLMAVFPPGKFGVPARGIPLRLGLKRREPRPRLSNRRRDIQRIGAPGSIFEAGPN